MADPEVRIAQKIYCQITTASPDTDKLIATYDTNTIYMKDGNLQPEEIFVVDHRNQTAGYHNLIVKILDQYNQEKASVTRRWKTLHDGIPIVGIDENNSIRVNGELFFPIFPLLEKAHIDYWVENGYVNAHGDMTYLNGKASSSDYTKEEYKTWLDYLAGIGIRNFGPTFRWAGMNGNHGDINVIREYVEYCKDSDGVLMWSWNDEPDGGGSANCAWPDEIRAWQETCHTYDTNHPHAVNLTAYGWAIDDQYYIDYHGNYSYLYGADWHNGEKKLIGDIIGFDYYPIEFAQATHFPGGITFANMTKAMDRLREWNYDLCPIFSWIESCDIAGEYTYSEPAPNFTCESTPQNRCTPGVDCPVGARSGGNCKETNAYIWTPCPTAEQMWSEYWLKVIHGAKGLKGHPHFTPECLARPPANHETMAKFMIWMDDLKEGVLGSDSEKAVTDDADAPGRRVDIMAKETESHLYIVTARLTEVDEENDPTIDVSFMVEGLGSTIASVYGEDRTISISNGTFQDSFHPWEVHVYMIPNVYTKLDPPLNLRFISE
jgi:hypothetical protein